MYSMSTQASFDGRFKNIHLVKVSRTTQAPGTLPPEIAAISAPQEYVGNRRNALTMTLGSSDNLSSTPGLSFGSNDGRQRYHSGLKALDKSYNDVGNTWLDSPVPKDPRTSCGQRQLLPPSYPNVGPLLGMFPDESRKHHPEGMLGNPGSIPTMSPMQTCFEHQRPASQMRNSLSLDFQDRSPECSPRQDMGRTSRNRRSGGNPSARNEFDGEVQYLPAPSQEEIAIRERNLPILSTHLDVKEQDRILGEVEKQLTECAYFFFARWQFPIPVERDERPVHDPEDREWNEWVHVLKRLATKRRIPARVLYNGQIKQFITVLENSLEMRHAVKHTSRPCKDDRNILQLISAGTQVAKIFKDAYAMEILNRLYKTTESTIEERRNGERIQNTRKMEEGPMRGCGTNQLDRSYPFKSGVIKSSAGFATIHCGQTIPSPESRGPNHIDMDPRSTAASSNIHYAKV